MWQLRTTSIVGLATPVMRAGGTSAQRWTSELKTKTKTKTKGKMNGFVGMYVLVKQNISQVWPW